jgi:signal transduction histidine kinase
VSTVINGKFKQAASLVVQLMQGRAGAKLARARQATEEIFNSFQTLFEKLAGDYNSTIPHEPLMVTVRRLPLSEPEDSATKKEPYLRLIISTSFWALSVRGANGTVEFFTLPATEVPTLRGAELPSRAKLRFTLQDHSVDTVWLMDGVQVNSDEMNTLMRSLFKDVVLRSRADFDQMPESMRLVAGAQSLTRSVRSLLGEKNALVQKIVNQQEDIQNEVARELHDAVLGNVMLLKRSLSSGSAKKMPDADMIAILDEIATRLRELCQDLSPRDLKDCGLLPMLEELCVNLGTRTGLNTTFDCPESIPEFPDEVALHIYRIAQECFNNITKHASASAVQLKITVQKALFTMIVKDDGKGFDVAVPAARTGSSGSGTSIIRERAELIECIYPTRVWIDSQPGSGTKMTLEIMFAADEGLHK